MDRGQALRGVAGKVWIQSVRLHQAEKVNDVIALPHAQISGPPSKHSSPWNPPTHFSSLLSDGRVWGNKRVAGRHFRRAASKKKLFPLLQMTTRQSRVVITPSLGWEFLFEWRRFVRWLTSSLVSVVTSLLVTGQWSASRRRRVGGWGSARGLCRPSRFSLAHLHDWWWLVKVRGSRVIDSQVVTSVIVTFGARLRFIFKYMEKLDRWPRHCLLRTFFFFLFVGLSTHNHGFAGFCWRYSATHANQWWDLQPFLALLMHIGDW